MTQTRHTTWQRAAGADPEESPCQTWLEGAVKENTVQVNIFGCRIFRHFQTDRTSDLWQLFEGPSQFEKPGNIAALWVILARASRLCIRGNSNVVFDTALHQRSNKNASFGVRPYLQGKKNGTQWRIWPCSPSSRWPRFLPAQPRPSPCLHLDLCKTNTWQYRSPNKEASATIHLFVSGRKHDSTCFGAELWCHSHFKRGKNRWVITREDVIGATWWKTNPAYDSE